MFLADDGDVGFPLRSRTTHSAMIAHRQTPRAGCLPGSRSARPAGSANACGLRVAVKLPPEMIAELRNAYCNVRSARPLDQRYWLAIPVGTAVPDSEVMELLAVSYDEVVRRLSRRSRPSDGGLDNS